MRKYVIAGTIALVAYGVSASVALALTLTSATGSFSNCGGSPNPPCDFSTAGEVWWGISTGSGQSGLVFKGGAPPSIDIGAWEEFEIGTLTHYNRPVTGTWPTSVDLALDLDFIDPTASESFTLTFTIDETPNSGAPGDWPYPSTIACSDRIGFPGPLPTTTIMFDGPPHVLEILGFEQGGSVVDEFISEEDGTNSASLVARLTSPLMDIEPGSCPNPLNTNGGGVLPVAIVGTAAFDASEVDPASVTLEGVSPLRWAMEDVSTPYTGSLADAYDCNDTGPDGYMDLTLKFKTQEIVAVIGAVNDGDVLVLQLTGMLKDGVTPIVGQDVVVIIKKGMP